jgi:hypothetical protein
LALDLRYTFRGPTVVADCLLWVGSRHGSFGWKADIDLIRPTSDLSGMVLCLRYRSPSPDEVLIRDEAAEETARRLLEEDAAGFRCSLTNARVSTLGDMKIVRMDLSRDETAETPGLAMCIEKAGLNYLGIFIE